MTPGYATLDTSKPAPDEPGQATRWRESERLYQMLEGDWRKHADQRIHEFFAKEVAANLPPAETSRNPYKSLTAQKSNLYDEGWQVDVSGEDGESLPTDPIIPARLLPLNQERLFFTLGMQEMLVRADWSTETGTVTDRLVYPHFVVAWAHEDRPDEIKGLAEVRPRQVDGEAAWCWETWDPSNDEKPFCIVAESKDGGEDVTTALMGPDWKEGDYPYMTADGERILPYVLYHARIGNRLWNWRRSNELASGTCTVAALWTWWLAGVRDGSYPFRYMTDGEVASKTTRQGPDGEGTPGGSVVIGDRTTLHRFFSSKGQKVALGQLAPTMEPRSAAEAFETFEAGLATHAGINPDHVRRGSSGQSGYAIVVSRRGLDEVRRKTEPACREGDQRLLALHAKLVNAYGDAEHVYPEAPTAYSIRYAEPPASIDEIKAETERAKILRELGVEDIVDTMIRIQPHLTEEGAIERLRQMRERARLLSSETVGEPPDFVNDLQAALDTLVGLLATSGDEVQGEARAALEDVAEEIVAALEALGVDSALPEVDSSDRDTVTAEEE